MATMSMLDRPEAASEILRLREELGLTEIQLAHKLMQNDSLRAILGRVPTPTLIKDAENGRGLPSVANTLIVFIREL